mmetsp:Transcript_22870/g.29628  ORF Transcript_22870/g.29628 Transcript_22870/m.29628 type:complete len:137 (-) Transcript_22870:240-650(-)
MGRGGKIGCLNDQSAQLLSDGSGRRHDIEGEEMRMEIEKSQKRIRKEKNNDILAMDDEDLDDISDEEVDEIEDLVEFARRQIQPTMLITPEIQYRTTVWQRQHPPRIHHYQEQSNNSTSFIAYSASIKGPNDVFED